MKKSISALLALSLTAASMTVLIPASAADAALLHSGFESGVDGWTARGSATIAQSTSSASSGSGCLSVTNRSENWAGAGISLDTTTFKPGETYSFSAMVSQSASPMAEHFKLSLQYSTGSAGGNEGGMFPGMGGGGGQQVYDCIAESDAASGMWTKLSNTSYKIPADAQNLLLYVETEGSKVDFLLDEVMIMTEGSSSVDTPPPPTGLLDGDLNTDKKIDKKDVEAMVTFLTTGSGDFSKNVADLNRDGNVDGIDLSLLKGLVLRPETIVTTEATVVTQEQPPVVTTTTEPEQQSGEHMNGKDYMAKVAATMTQNVPANVKTGDRGKTEHFTYMSKKAGHNKGANVWLPPGYDSSKKYNVLYMNHGVMGNEDSMLSGFSVREMASNMISSGEAEPFIIIFPQMYTDPTTEQPGFGFNMDVMDHYDDFVFDLTDSLMPYVEEHWSVYTGREHTAVAGFSMGGRESLYLGLMHPELFGYVCASSPAPGIVPASDSFIPNHLGSYNLDRTARLKPADLKFPDGKLPYLLMIAGGTSDNVVGTFPKEYHQIFDQNGVPNIWTEVPGGGHDGGVGTPLFYNFFRNMFKA